MARATIAELKLQLGAERQRRIELEGVEHSLREQAARCAFAIEGTEAGIVDWDIVNGTMEFSDQWLAITGYSREELSPRLESFTDLIHPDELPTALADIDEVLAGRKRIHAFDHRLKHKEGHWILDSLPQPHLVPQREWRAASHDRYPGRNLREQAGRGRAA